MKYQTRVDITQSVLLETMPQLVYALYIQEVIQKWSVSILSVQIVMTVLKTKLASTTIASTHAP